MRTVAPAVARATAPAPGRRGRANVSTTPTQVLCNLYMDYFLYIGRRLARFTARAYSRTATTRRIQFTEFTRRGFPFPSARVRACVSEGCPTRAIFNFSTAAVRLQPTIFRGDSHRLLALESSPRSSARRTHCDGAAPPQFRLRVSSSRAARSRAAAPRRCSNILRGGRSTVANWAQPEPRLHLQKREEIHHPHTHKSFR